MRPPMHRNVAQRKRWSGKSRTLPTTAIDTACPVGFNPDGRVGQIKFVSTPG